MLKTIAVAGTILVLALSGCGYAGSRVDIDAEKAAIEEMLADWLEATNTPGAEGAEAFVSFVMEGAVWLPPNSVRVDGRAGVHALILPFTEAKDFSEDWQVANIEVASDGKTAYVIGTYEFSLKDAAGNSVSETGNFLDILKKQADSSWKCAVATWSSDQPVGGVTE